MKKLMMVAILIAMIFSGGLRAQNFTLDSIEFKKEAVHYTHIVNTNLSAKQAYIKALTWFSDIYVNSNEVIQMQNINTHTIVGKFNYNSSFTHLMLTIKCTIKVQCKDNRVRIQIYRMYYDVPTYNAKTPMSAIFLSYNQLSERKKNKKIGRAFYSLLKHNYIQVKSTFGSLENLLLSKEDNW